MVQELDHSVAKARALQQLDTQLNVLWRLKEDISSVRSDKDSHSLDVFLQIEKDTSVHVARLVDLIADCRLA